MNGNPLYHWTHLELNNPFGIHDLLSERTARRIFERCNELLAQSDFVVCLVIANEDYTGFNPDVNSGGSDENVYLGTEFYSYPLARSFLVGISGAW